MPDILGRTGSGLRERVGSLTQVVRIDRFVETQGAARGARRLRMVNGGGIEVEVHPDRALDLGRLTVDGIPLSWISSAGITAPQFYDATGNAWLRTFGGGMLATCGLDTFGPPSEDAGQTYGLHGRIGAQPANVTRVEATEEHVCVEGLVRQSSVFGEDLLLKRCISSVSGSDSITICDSVTNESFVEASHMILYHMNLGWPLLDTEAVISIPSYAVIPRDETAEMGVSEWDTVDPPTENWREQVFRHDFEESEEVRASIVNPRIGLEFGLHFKSAQLPHLFQWKMMGQGHYVLGLEPSNCKNIFGRTSARDAKELPTLLPGQTTQYTLTLQFSRITQNQLLTGVDPTYRKF